MGDYDLVVIGGGTVELFAWYPALTLAGSVLAGFGYAAFTAIT